MMTEDQGNACDWMYGQGYGWAGIIVAIDMQSMWKNEALNENSIDCETLHQPETITGKYYYAKR